ncbi:hypothetical protein JW916_03035 [Candidatus Sumerlaeota bacterium]|nr:hypothetical protein [Candidatus Sumerlaeota bacterium]
MGAIAEFYVGWVGRSPLVSAAIQFAVLGTLGEIVSLSLSKRRFTLPCGPARMILKVVAWAILGVFVKYGFTGMKGFAEALFSHGMLPGFVESGWGRAFVLSLLLNTFFGPHVMFFHRLEDCLILWRWDFRGISRALWALLWFWIPAHTITFALPATFQLGLAAVWSFALGIIMGFSKKT